jgi:hypothetical protein
MASSSKHKDVCSRITIEQPGVAIQVADETHVLVEPECCDQLPQRRARRAFACDHEQRLGHCRTHLGECVHQKIDVLLVGEPADVEHERSLRGQVVRGTKTRAIARAETMGG